MEEKVELVLHSLPQHNSPLTALLALQRKDDCHNNPSVSFSGHFVYSRLVFVARCFIFFFDGCLFND